MEVPIEEPFQKPRALYSPVLGNYFYFPAGSVSSFMDSIISEGNKSSGDEIIYDPSCHVITYESICTTSIISKETQTDAGHEKQLIQELSKSLIDLKSKYESLKKQNIELRNEQQSYQLSQKSKDPGVREEVKKLKATINFHHSMVEKIASLVADITGEQESPNRFKVDVHIYNFIISKLEIIRSRMKRFKTKIHSMESEKCSLTELINFYAGATKLIENSRLANLEQQDSSNPLTSSRKSSALMENSSNTIRNPPFDCSDLKKKPLSYGDGTLDQHSLPNTISNLKGISKLAATSTGFKKTKPCGSCSVSPLLPKPKKGPKGLNSKENFKSCTVKVGKNEETKKRRSRCKS
jgi:hypothetical protein